MSMLYTVSPEVAFSALGQPFWKEGLPNIHASGLTKPEIDLLVIFWRKQAPSNTGLLRLTRSVRFQGSLGERRPASLSLAQ
jgi:hypothetical protein